MPGREVSLIADEIYHIFNKSNDAKHIFKYTREKIEFIQLLKYYSYTNIYLRFSLYKQLSPERKRDYDYSVIKQHARMVDILAYCLMPTHFHILLRQQSEGGISRYLSQIQNSYTRYFNTKHNRVGHIFVHSFKAVHISSEEQFKHVSRYIHLNPYSGKLINTKEEVCTYPWSSCKEYLGEMNDYHISHPIPVLSCFGNNPERYRTFLLDNADYQQMLEHCKHAYKWEDRL